MFQAIHDWLTMQRALGRADSTLYTYKRRLSYFADYARINNCHDSRNINIQLIQKYHDLLIKQKMRNNSIYSYMSTIQTWLSWLYQHDRIMIDVASSMEMPRMESTLPPIALSVEELRTIFEELPILTVIGKRNKALIILLYACGLRRNEAILLNCGSLNWENNVLSVMGKGEHQRQVPVCQYARTALTEYLQIRGKLKPESPLFVKDDGKTRITEGSIQRFFVMLNKKQEQHLYPHLLRHCFAIHLLQNGADLRYVQCLLGHSSPDVTSRYLGIVKNQLKREYDRAMDRLFVSE